MSGEIQIRTVRVEFLRAGPPHNQLLSPLTPYLGVCGNAGAGVVKVPYEQAAFERRLKELRYETGDAGDRLAMLHDVGVDMGKVLGAVPGLPGTLTTDAENVAILVHLRLTLSASELAHLPFELAKVPVGPEATTESWLAIQTRPPICITRNIRTVLPESVVWPSHPRILFITGAEETVPYEEHRDALLSAIEPFRYSEDANTSDAARDQFGEVLTILRNPTLTDVMEECGREVYTHVHILTHGDEDETSRGSYGLVLRGQDGASDVVSGERFASALTSVGADSVHRPAVVTVASCDSGNVGTVVVPGASFAHALHQSGIPLVVASQFPLSVEGSVPLVRTLYNGLLWGEHPLLLLHRVRAELHARFTSTWHDWASLVVYEALPYALESQLDSLRYQQARRAMNAALERIDRVVQKKSRESLPELDRVIESVLKRMPFAGQYGVECLGLRASARKRMAQAATTLKEMASSAGKRWHDPLEFLEQSWADYNDAVRRLLVNDRTTVQRKATLHWVLVQSVSLSAVLGKEEDEERWKAAKLCADHYCGHSDLEERAWAYASLAELYLLRLAHKGLTDEHREKHHNKALHYGRELANAYPFQPEFPITSTLRQLRRYVDWWGRPDFEQALLARGLSKRNSWDALGNTARELIGILARSERHAPSDDSGSGGPPDTDGGGPSSQTPPHGETDAAPSTEKPATSGSKALRGRSKAATPARGAPVAARRDGAFFDIEMLPAGHGDALWIEYGQAEACHRVLIDCGTRPTAALISRRVEQMPAKERRLDLFVMSHIDADHIGGALPFLDTVRRGLRVGDVWFNGWRHLSGQLGARQGEMFSTAIQDLELPWNEFRDGDAIVVQEGPLPEYTLPGGMKITLLSPLPAELRKLAPVWTRELKRHGLEPGARMDYSRFLKGTPSTSTDVDELADERFIGDAAAPNGTSIAFLAEYGGATALLGADAYAPVLGESIKRLLQQRGAQRLALNALKVAHHGSKNNLSAELLALLDCPQYLLSSNGDYFCHPDRQTVARMIKHGGPHPSLRFNYRSRFNDVWDSQALKEKYGYAAEYPRDGEGMVVSLLAPREELH